MWEKLRLTLGMIRFSHTVFALPFACLAAVMAWTVAGPDGAPVRFRWLHLLGILLCMVTARSAAMAYNRVVDRRLDAENPRTRSRHLPAGVLTTRGVIVFTATASILFVLSTLLFLPNRWPLYLSLPVLAFLLGYSHSKRFTSLAHFWLGAALMAAPIAAWIALRGTFLLENPADLTPAVVLGLAVLLWVAGFDIIYACQDVDFDRKARLRSVPARLGVVGALRVAATCHGAMVAALLALPAASRSAGLDLGLGPIFYAGIGVIGLLLLVEHRLVKPDDLGRVNLAFFHMNAVISLGLFVLVSLDLLW